MKEFCDSIQLVCGLVVWGLLGCSFVVAAATLAYRFYAMNCQ